MLKLRCNKSDKLSTALIQFKATLLKPEVKKSC